MRKQEVISRARPINANKVIITVYVEKPRNSSPAKIDLAGKCKPEPSSKPPEIRLTESFNRRAELLAYSRELRQTHSMPKFKDEKSSEKNFRRRRDEQEQIRLTHNIEVQQFNNSRKKKASKSKFGSNFCRKVKSVLKELSCGLGCIKG